MNELDIAKDDARLLQAIAKQRDQEALAQLFERYHKVAFNLALRITRRREIAEDVFQDAMVVVWQSAGTCRELGKVRGWLLRIVALKSMRHLRDRGREGRSMAMRKDIEEDFRIPISTDSLEKKEVIGALKKAYRNLDESESQLLSLYFAGGLTQSDIGKALGLSSRTVSYRIQVCLEKLRSTLAGAGILAVHYSEEELRSAFCLEISSDPVVDLEVSQMAKRVCSEHGMAAGSMSGGYKVLLAAVVAVVGVVGALALSNGNLGVDVILAANDASAEGAGGIMPIPPVHIRWDFDVNDQEGLDVTYGQWSWKPAQDGRLAGMYSNAGDGVFVRPAVLIPPEPLKITMTLRYCKSESDKPNQLNVIMGSLWELEGRLEEQLRTWRNRDYLRRIVREKEVVVYTYLFDKYSVSLMDDGFVYTVMEHKFANCDQHVLLLFKNVVVESIELQTIAFEKIPSKLREPLALTKNLVAKGMLKLDPPPEEIARKLAAERKFK